MRIKQESDILDQEIRAKIIEEIKSPENQARKDRFYKFYQCYKDNTKEYVIDHLRKQFDADTVSEMSYSITNLGFARKAVDKLARVYNYGVEREAVDDKATTEAITVATKECDINRIFKKTNRWLKRDKNCVQYIMPKKLSFSDDKWTIKPIVLPAYLYDAVELEDNREVPVCFILSNYKYRQTQMLYTANPAVRMTVADSEGNYPYHTDGKDNLIADNPKDQDNEEYVFWTNNHHFTTDAKGNIISEGGIENPIGVMPFVNYAEDQDNSFWSIGGDDLIDGAININTLITNVIHIAVTQGYGQAVMSGPNPPRNLKMGPNKVILLEQKNNDEPKPTFEFVTANPPLAELRQLVEFYVALLLTTNNLSTSGVSTSLGNSMAFASGISMMIDKSESVEDIEDQRQIFLDNEPVFWDIFAKWHAIYKNKLAGDLGKVSFADNFTLSVKFGKPTTIMSEAELLANLKTKVEMGIMSKLDALKEFYPDLTDEQLLAKLEEIAKEKVEAALKFGLPVEGDNKEENQNESEDEANEEENSTEASGSEEEKEVVEENNG